MSPSSFASIGDMPEEEQELIEPDEIENIHE